MKNLVVIILSFVIFVGCAPKPEVVLPKEPIKPAPIVVEPKPIVVEPEPILVEPAPIVIEEVNKIAVIYPSKIVGKYAKTTLNTISAYLIYLDKKFEIETFDTMDESPENITNEIRALQEKGFTKVIAMFTQNGFNVLNAQENLTSIYFYFPLIHKEEVVTQNSNFLFGGISYDRQMDLLSSMSSGRNTMFYVESYIGNKLKQSYMNKVPNFGIIKEIERQNNNYKYIMNDNKMIGSTVFLNTPIIKSSIILSQLTTYEVNPIKILSTQLNYSPLMVKLTQAHDRENLYVVNSILDVDVFLEEYTKLLDADINYNWVDYSSLVGVNYLLFTNESNWVHTKIVENQADYLPMVYKATSYGFEKLPQN